jgi:PAS domain S-box-containing protein/putative nucleotidyltransferase with HDIG domain
MMPFPLHLLLLLLTLCWLPITGVAEDEEVRIGVLAKLGEQAAYERWTPTAEYLTREIPGYRFRVVPIDFHDVLPTAAAAGVEFFIINPEIYVELEYRFGASRILTLRNRHQDQGYTEFGAVIITRQDHPTIRTLDDLRGHSFAAVESNSLGGFLMAWRELQEIGINPRREFRPLGFVGTHDGVVHAVQAGQYEAGTVRTDTLERMALAGLIDLNEFRIIDARQYPGFPFLVSTHLYPEWPLARARHTPDWLGDRVAVALLEIPADHPAALTGEYTGWTVPRDYQPVHELMRDLRVGPYEWLGVITPRQVLAQYWQVFLLGIALVVLLAVSTVWFRRLTRQLRRSERAVREARDNLELRVHERTAELEQANLELKESRRQIEMTHRDWHDAFDAIKDPIFIHDRDLRIVHANPAYADRAGLAPEELLGRIYYEVFPRRPEPLRACAEFPERLPEGDGEEVVLPNGQILVSRSFGIRRADGSYRHAIHILEDLTEARRSARELQRLNRALRTISRANEALVRAGDERQLLNEICLVLVETGGYRMAWVGYAAEDEACIVQPVALAGYEEGFLQAAPTTWADDPCGRGPTGTAIRERRPVTSHDLQTDPRFELWRDEAIARGYASVIALPLVDEGELYGAVSIYAAEPDAFDTREVLLLQELADDLAFGVHMLRIRAEGERAVRDLAASEARYEELFQHAPAGYLSLRPEDGTVLQLNEAAVRMLGYARAELMGTSLLALFPAGENGLAKAESLFRRFAEGAPLRDQELQIRRKDGKILWISLTADPVLDEENRVVECRASILDISKRKEAELEQQRLSERLKRGLVQTIQAIAVTIEKRDPYTAGHQQRVAELAVVIAREMGLSENRIEGLRLGAMIHDIGKIYVPAEVLNRPGKLDPLEFNFIRTHPQVGYEIISGVDFPWPVAEMVLQHHERLDGSGYPEGLKADDIILEARILAVADVVEAIINHRPYRPALKVEHALEEIKEDTTARYDASVVSAFLRLLSEKRVRLPVADQSLPPRSVGRAAAHSGIL